MRGWKNLPYEILAIIFEVLENVHDITECQHTCKSWGLSAQEKFYKNILLMNIAKVMPFLRTISNTENRTGSFVKSIDFFLGRNSEIDSVLVNQIAFCCPNIEVLSGSWIKGVWKNIALCYRGGFFSHLREIDFTIEASDYHDYIDTMLLLRKNMTKLLLKNNISDVDLTSEYNKLVQKLPTFPELTKLVARTRSFVNIFQLELFVDRCNPSLKSITFTALEPVEEVDPNQLLNKSMHLVIPQYSVEDLIIEGVSLKPNVILYLIHKFPRLKT